MAITRRDLAVGGIAAGTALAGRPPEAEATDGAYGLIGQILTLPGKRDEFLEILGTGAAGAPGCLSYVVAKDAGNENAVWVTEIWRDRDSHAASLKLPAVQAAIAKGKPLIAGVGARAETVPVAVKLSP